jgi:hypothetical protein
MTLPRIDFTSFRDPNGYEIREDTPQEIADARTASEAAAKFLGVSEAVKEIPSDAPEWVRDEQPAGRLEKNGPWISGHIVGKGGKLKMVDVDLSQWPRAFEKFAEINTPTGLLEFVTKHGPLYLRPQYVLPLLKEARRMRKVMRGGTIEPDTVGHLSAQLYQDRETGELEISITPSCLLHALWLQFQQSQSSGAEFRICPYCKGPFAAGGNSGRRSIAEFCSEEHRKRFNSLARSNPKMRERRK